MEKHTSSIIFNDSGADRRPTTEHYPNQNQEIHGILCIFNDSGAAGAPRQHYSNQETHAILYI